MLKKMIRFGALLVAALYLATASFAAAPSATLMTNPLYVEFDNNGQPLAGGMLYTYYAGTNVPLATFTDATLLYPNPNPVILDQYGKAQVWFSNNAYKVNLTDALGVQQPDYPVDNLRINTVSGTSLASLPGAGLVGYSFGQSYPTNTVGVALQSFSSITAGSDGSSLIGNNSNMAGSVGRTQHSKNLDSISVKDFGATGNGTTNDAASIQAAINAVHARGGGRVCFPQGVYNLGTTGLTVYQFMELLGESQPYVSTQNQGVVLTYSGTGTAIFGQDILNLTIENISINGAGTTGAAVIGIYLEGCWLSTLRNVRISGITPLKGYGILIDTDPGNSWGSQHIYFERCECPDGTVRLAGTGPSDQVTTTVINTFRGCQYEIYNSQVCLINATAEGWQPAGTGYTGRGFNIDQNSDVLMLHCDIENSSTTVFGITIGNACTVRGIGTCTWTGFAGSASQRVSGYEGALSLYGGGHVYRDLAPAAGSLMNPVVTWEDANAFYAQIGLMVNNVTGGAQDGYLQFKRIIAGSLTITHELGEHMLLHTSKSCNNVATTVMTVPIAAYQGGRVKITANGTEPGNVAFAHTRECVVANNGGTLVLASGNELRTVATSVITFVASGTNLLIQYNYTSTTASSVDFVVEIEGKIFGYTKN
jgi:hypothetical protein